jgi:hypothetical protein
VLDPAEAFTISDDDGILFPFGGRFLLDVDLSLNGFGDTGFLTFELELVHDEMVTRTVLLGDLVEVTGSFQSSAVQAEGLEVLVAPPVSSDTVEMPSGETTAYLRIANSGPSSLEVSGYAQLYGVEIPNMLLSGAVAIG